jgi:SSU ribosomal protein S30P/sigma 54 modulation protein
MEQSEALKSYAEEKLERVAKYIDEPISAQVYFTVEKIRHIVEIVISGRGITTKASEATKDMYAAVDAVLDKIERQLKRYKEKLKITSLPARTMAAPCPRRSSRLKGL